MLFSSGTSASDKYNTKIINMWESGSQRYYGMRIMDLVSLFKSGKEYDEIDDMCGFILKTKNASRKGDGF